MHEVLVNRLGGLSLPRKSVVRLTDRPDMTLDVYRGRKTTMQQYRGKLEPNIQFEESQLTADMKHCIKSSRCNSTVILVRVVLPLYYTMSYSAIRMCEVS